ncbi:MAG TPA: fused MFS/spermidine synthase [Pirellulales bacterium]
MIRYAVTIFLGAFLLFQVQPLIGKFILPWFGGSPAVWTTCMLFFQVVLLGGYSYAHLVASRLSPRALAACHGGLLLISLAFLPIAPDPAWKTTEVEMPIARILALLSATIGLPYLLLSTTGPLLQESFRRETGQPPYRLYSLSNVGSLLALLSYPFLFEPQLTLNTQIAAWSWAYAAFVALGLWCSFAFARLPDERAALAAESAAGPAPSWRDILLWLSLAACGSIMLLATTNQLCQEVSSVPFLWVVPLAIYLFSFIICFDHERWYHRSTFLVALAAAVLLAGYALYKGNGLNLWQQLVIYSLTLFACVMVCHGELVRARPAPRYATLFYLMVAAGGALGGIAVAVVAPLVLRDYWEYHIGLILTVALAFIATLSSSENSGRLPRAGWVAAGGLAIAIGLALGWSVGTPDNPDYEEQNIETTRNFYGVLRVNREADIYDDNGPKRELIHGRIQHGFQYLDPEKSRLATTYYGPPSGIGLAITHHPRRGPAGEPLRIGVVGLGCGTLATYGRPGDTVRFYEINPAVVRISDEYFSYRRDSAAEVNVVLGDARIEMERELVQQQPQKFDILAVDAFSSDSIPMHLLTEQCAHVFADHLKEDGILCIHISNRFLELSGVVKGVAETLGWPCIFIDSKRDRELGLDVASWALVTKNGEFLANSEIKDAVADSDKRNQPTVIWTDDYGSLWQVLDFQ